MREEKTKRRKNKTNSKPIVIPANIHHLIDRISTDTGEFHYQVVTKATQLYVGVFQVHKEIEQISIETGDTAKDVIIKAIRFYKDFLKNGK